VCVTGALFFLTVPSVQAADSNWQQANAKIVDAHRKGQLAAGARLAEENLQYATQTFGPEHPSTGTSLNNLAGFYRSMGQYDKALPMYQRALVIARPFGVRADLVTLQGNIAFLHSSLKQPDLAIYFGKAAVNTMQSLRASNVALDVATRQALLKTQSATYELVAQWLIEAGRLSEAQQVLAMPKEDELSLFTRRRAEACGGGSVRASFNGPETQINERVERSMSELGQLALESSQLRKVRPTERTPAQQERLSLLELAPQETKVQSVRKAQFALIEGRHAEPTSANVQATAAAAARAPVRVNRQGGVAAKAYVPQKDKPYAHPYYWAPFVLMGNWL
jgi:tetratricopeptide (TPR) repeat protein